MYGSNKHCVSLGPIQHPNHRDRCVNLYSHSSLNKRSLLQNAYRMIIVLHHEIEDISHHDCLQDARKEQSKDKRKPFLDTSRIFGK
jgi:hypothetical protein